jgi:hypothetical protein
MRKFLVDRTRIENVNVVQPEAEVQEICVEMNHRFSEGSNIVLDCFSCLDPKNSFSKFDVDKLARLADIYHDDFSDDHRGTIREQLDTYVLQVKRHASFSSCEDVQSLAMKMVQTEKHLVFPLVYKLIELALILSMSTASVERAFSAMKIIKTKLRNKINNEWLNDLMICYTEREIFKSLDDIDSILSHTLSLNMAGCFSFTASRDRCYRFSFSNAGLKSTTTDLGNTTIMHCWVPKSHKSTKPSLLLLHGMGANAMWQWNEFISPLTRRFNLYVPDLLFFGESHTSKPDRTESFQAQCVAALMEAHGVRRMNVVGVSYGGFVGYSLAALFPERVEKVALCCAEVCLEDKDMEDGLFVVKNIDEAAMILIPQTPEKMKQLVKLTFVISKLCRLPFLLISLM